ncbi:MAG: hypothetical protein R2715_20005 [Ilumatobacteraceae bacterium]
MVVIDDDALPDNATLESYDAVVISSSVVPNKIPARLADLATGIVDSEAYTGTTLKLATSGRDVGGQNSLVVTPGHPISGDLEGTTRVVSSSSFASYAPAASAEVVATLSNGSASVFSIEQGAALTSGTAPARRVGFFFSYDAPKAANSAGLDLFVRAVRWAAAGTPAGGGGGGAGGGGGGVPPTPCSGPVVLIAGNDRPPSGDRPTADRLTSLGYDVIVVDDDRLTEASLAGAQLVVVSSSVVPDKVPAWLRNVAIPMLATESYAQDDLGLADNGTDVGGQRNLVVSSTHPIAAGFAGTVTVGGSATIAAMVPAPGAEVIASLSDGRAAVVALDPGDALLGGGAAPARRVGYYFGYDTPGATNADGWRLFDQSIAWLTGH